MMFPKDAPGTFTKERRKRSRHRHVSEQAIMREAVALDGGRCRFPHCPHKHLVVDPCHAVHRGMGGDKSGARTTLESIIAFCRVHHEDYDAGRIDFDCKTARGTRGPCWFYRLVNGAMELVGVERLAGVLA